MSDDTTIALDRLVQEGKIKFNRDNKFDIQLTQAFWNERRLAAIFGTARIEKIELKSENYLWEKTGNICIEYKRDGKPSGISVTEADYWVHELLRDYQTLCYLMFPIERLKELCRRAHVAGNYRKNGGDGGCSSNILIPLKDILR